MKFSIVIPTLNRCGILGNAIRTALNQSYDDYEILISNNGSTDDTENVVQGFDDPRIRYVKRHTTVCMNDHWDWILEQVKGDWIIFLSDDDALLSYCLQYLDKAVAAYPEIELFSYRFIHYFYGGRLDGLEKVLVVPENLNNSIKVLDSRKELVERFKAIKFRNPAFPTACVSRAFLNRIREKYGKNFFMWTPDISSGFVHLANSREFCRINLPLAISGKGVHSYGSGARQNPNRMFEYLSQLPGFHGTFEYSPYPNLFVVSNLVLDTMLKVKMEVLQEELKNVEVDPEAMGLFLMKDVQKYLDRGLEEYREFGGRIQDELLGGSNGKDFSSHLKKLLPKSLRPLVRKMMYGSGSPQTKPEKIRVQGDAASTPFSDIVGAGECFEKHYGPFRDGQPVSLPNIKD